MLCRGCGAEIPQVNMVKRKSRGSKPKKKRAEKWRKRRRSVTRLGGMGGEFR